MITNFSNEVTARSRAPVRRTSSTSSVSLPYEVRIDGIRAGKFDDLHDALASARIAKHGKPMARVAIADIRTGQMVIELEA